MSPQAMHDINVIGSLQLLAACERSPTVRAIVIRGSAGIYGSEPQAPQFFTEEMARLYPLRTRFQRDVGEIENYFETYSRRHPQVTCMMLRYQPAIGPATDTQVTRYLGLPVVPDLPRLRPAAPVHPRERRARGARRVDQEPAARRGERGGARHDRPDEDDPPGRQGVDPGRVAALPDGRDARPPRSACSAACRPTSGACCATAARSTRAGWSRRSASGRASTRSPRSRTTCAPRAAGGSCPASATWCRAR